MSLIEKLTPEQEALIPVYREKWRSIALSTEPIDRQKAREAVKAAYKLIGKQEPEIIFFDSPYAFLNYFPPQLEGVLGDSYEESVIDYILDNEIAIAFYSSLYTQLESQVEINVRIQLERELEISRLNEQRYERLNSQMWDEMYEKLIDQLGAEELDSWAEYTLLKIDIDIDDAIEQEEPIYLLKMTCPSPGAIHALRVPPDIQSAKEAIRWVNWGIGAEEFTLQT